MPIDQQSSEARPLASPLDLVVHSMPEPGGRLQPTPSGRLKLLALVLICLTPAIAAYLFVFAARPQGHATIGELIQPLRPLPELDATELDGRTRPLASLKGQWLLLSVGPSRCDPACDKRLFLQRQLHDSLGKDRSRLEHVWLITDSAPLDPRLAASLSGAVVLRVPAQALSAWLAPAPGHGLEEHLYLVDPLGHWMIRFPAQLDLPGASKVKRDLEQLLRASASWQSPARPRP